MPGLSLLQQAAWRNRRYRRRFRGGIGGSPQPVTFPSSPLTARVYIALGADLTSSLWWQWNWVDITAYVRQDLGVSYTVGRRDESTRVTASSAVLRLDNRDGRFSRRNPVGPYYGKLTRNTPIWIQVNPGSGFVDRYFGYVNEWPNRWSDPSGLDSYVTVRCGGVMRRLAQGSNLQPCLHRAIIADNPVHYWRLDDDTGTTLAASSLANGGQTMTAASVGWRQIASPPGGDGATSAAKMNSAALLAGGLNVAAPWTVEWSTLRPQDGTLDGQPIFSLRFTAGGSTQTVGVTTTLDTSVSARDWYHYKAEGVQNGSNWEVNWWKNGISKGLIQSGPGTMGTFDQIISSGVGIVASDFSVGYFAVYQGSGVIDAAVHSNALQAFDGELAHARIIRLCAEEGVPVLALAPASAAMGAQGHATFLELLRECEEADQGVLFEHQFGLRYQSVYERCNQPVTLALDFNAGHIAGTPEPADDDQRLRNQWSTSRTDGTASRTARDQDSVDASGLYDDSSAANLQTDGQILDHASWHVHVGTADEDRWPRIPFHLHRPTNSSLIPAWLATPLGARAAISNPPSGSDPGAMAPDPIDQIVEGYSEAFDQVAWGVSLNLAPSSPYRVAVLDDQLLGRLDSASSTLTSDIDSTTTSISVTTTDSRDLWTTDAAEVPFDIVIGGEVMTVTNISGASSPQTFTVTRSVNGAVKAHTANNGALSEVHLRYPAILAL